MSSKDFIIVTAMLAAKAYGGFHSYRQYSFGGPVGYIPFAESKLNFFKIYFPTHL